MNSFLSLARIENRILMTSKIAVFWTFAFPIILLAAQARLGAAGTDDPTRLGKMLAGVIAIVVTSTALMGFTAPLVQSRENGTLRTSSLWPISKLTLLGAMAAARLLTISLASVALVTVAVLYLGARFPNGNAPLFIAILLLGSASLLCLATLLGSRMVKTQSAIALCNIIYFGMIFLGEIFYSRDALPPSVASVMAWLPVNALVHGLFAALMGHYSDIAQPIVALSVILLGSAVATHRTFLWTAQPHVTSHKMPPDARITR